MGVLLLEALVYIDEEVKNHRRRPGAGKNTPGPGLGWGMGGRVGACGCHPRGTWGEERHWYRGKLLKV